MGRERGGWEEKLTPVSRLRGCPTGGGDIQAGLERGGKTDSVKEGLGSYCIVHGTLLDIMRQPEWEEFRGRMDT